MKASVMGVERATPSVVILRLRPESRLSFSPGQFVQVVIREAGRAVAKPYSIASSPASGGIEFCVKVVESGFASNYLASLKPGDELEIRGPFGHFTLQEHSNEVVFIATGTGISALKPMIDSLLRDNFPHDVWLFFGVRSEDEIIYRRHFESLAFAHKNFHFVPVISNSHSAKFERGYVQDAFRKLIAPADQDVYICGLFRMVDEARKVCADLGFPDEKIHFEKYI